MNKKFLLFFTLLFIQFNSIAQNNLVEQIIRQETSSREIKIKIFGENTAPKEYISKEKEIFITEESNFYDLTILQIYQLSEKNETFTVIEKDEKILFSYWYSISENRFKVYQEDQSWGNWKLFYKNKTGYSLNEKDEIMFPKRFVWFSYEECNVFMSAENIWKKSEKLIREENQKELIKWLWSMNTEVQLYGAKGLKRLEAQGYEIPNLTKERIEFIKNSNQTINVCVGCTFSQINLKEAL